MKRISRFCLAAAACTLLAACTSGTYQSDRKPYAGFRWEHISGAGLDFWAQTSDRLRIVTDSSLPGAVLVNGAGLRLDTILRVFQPNGALPDSLIALLRRQPGWDESQTAVLKEITSPWKGRRRYVIVPAGAYGDSIDALMLTTPVSSTCSGWGIGNSGMRYFETFAESPGRILFVNIGQEQPLFDEASIKLQR